MLQEAAVLLDLLLLLLDEVLEHVNGQREDDGGVLLGRDGVERLEVAELQCGRGLTHDVSGLLQGTGSLLLSLGGDHLVTWG